MDIITGSWYRLYKDGWQGEIVPEAFSHPAKFARGLIRRIYKHALEQGYLEEGAVVIDPFDGVALGALDAMFHGLHHIGVELEEKFVQLGQQNIDLWNRRYGNGKLRRWGTAAILQGDSRRLCEVLEGAKAQMVCSSPPYADQMSAQREGTITGGDHFDHGYGTDPAQLGNMPTGEPPSAIVSSPSFSPDQPCASQTQGLKDYHAFTRSDGTKRDHIMRSLGNIADMPTGEPPGDHTGGASSKMPGGVETTFDLSDVATRQKDARGEMPVWATGCSSRMVAGESEPPQAVITSPPFADSQQSKDADFVLDSTEANLMPRKLGDQSYFPAEMEGDGQLAALPEGDVDAVIASPPYAESLGSTDMDFIRNRLTTGPSGSTKLRGAKGAQSDGQTYGTSDGQLAALPEGEPPQAIVSSPPFGASLPSGTLSEEMVADLRAKGHGPARGSTHKASYGTDPNNLGNMSEGEPPAVAKPKLASQENRGIISQEEIIPCQIVKTAGNQYQDEADGVNHVAESTSVQLSRGARNPKDLGPKSQQLDSINQPQNVGMNHIPIGKAEMTVGEDTPGGLSAEQPLTEMGTSVSSVDQQIASKSITKRIKQKPTEPGTTNSLTLKPSVSNVTLPSTVPQNTMQHALYAEKVTSQHPLENVVQMSAERNPKSAPGESITESNLPNTFWEAAKIILLQCHQVLAPGGVAIFVTKRFVRNKQIVEFSQQWADLCQSCGFELIEWIKAWLVEERGTQYDLEGEAHTKIVKRFSFFRRLHAQKYPRLAIEWEDVLVFRKPDHCR